MNRQEGHLEEHQGRPPSEEVQSERAGTPSAGTPETPEERPEDTPAELPDAVEAQIPGQSEPGPKAKEPIMGQLPRSRPKRETPRRKPARPRSPGTPTTPRAGATGKRPARSGASSRPRGARPAGTTASPRSRTAANRTRAARARAAKSVAPAAPRRREEAPGLPRLALDGAIEAAKLPVKVSANVTIRALDAITKGLRRR